MLGVRALGRLFQPKKVNLSTARLFEQNSQTFFTPESSFVSFTSAKNQKIAQEYIDSLSMLGSDLLERRYPLSQFMQLTSDQQDSVFNILNSYRARTTFHDRFRQEYCNQLDIIFDKVSCQEENLTSNLNC